MDKDYSLGRFDSVLRYLPERISKRLYSLEKELKQSAEEIRLRAGRPLTITVGNSQFFILKNDVSMLPKGDMIIVSSEELEQTFDNLCNHSVYSHSEEIKEGYIMLEEGHRAGVCGTFIGSGGDVSSLRDISSINIRIAKEVKFCAGNIIKDYDGGGILVCGGPGSGKTTLIRDMVRHLAGGMTGHYYKVAVVDTRGELAAVKGGVPTADLGSTTDVITACPKPKGIEMALRTLYPDVIAFDEVGDVAEVEAVRQSMNSGVSVITSAHIGSVAELKKRSQTKALLETGAIKRVVFCKKDNGFNYEVYNADELKI